MIILDETEQGSSKLAAAPAPPLRLPDPVAGRSSVALPDYETSQAQVGQQNPRNDSTTSLISFRKPSLPHRFDSRFWRITFFALALYVFLSVVIGIPLIVTRIKFRQAHTPPPPPPPDIASLFLDETDQSAPPLAVVGSGTIMAASSTVCDLWVSKSALPGGQFIAIAQHTLPFSEGVFAVRSNATDEVVPRPGGMHNLTVAINDDASEPDVVITVSLTTSSVELRDQAHICFVSVGDGRGLSVYVPQDLAPTDVQAFDIHLLFPQNSTLTVPDGIVRLTSLITYLPMFQQTFADLHQIFFNTISITGAGLDIICDSLLAEQIGVKTSFANLSGKFAARQSLKLDNIEGSINVNTTLYNDPSTELATYLIVDTGNSDVVADVTMVSTKPSQRPKFNVNAQTFNGSLWLNVGHDAATVPAALMLLAQNNQGPVHITVDKKFTGPYDLHTKLASAGIDYSRVLVHSTSAGNTAKWQFLGDSNSTSYTRGWVGTGTRPKVWNPATDGKLTVGSSLEPVSLRIVP